MRWLCVLVLLCPLASQAGEVVDATGRHVDVPEGLARVLPAGPPAAVLLAILAPELMLGWPSKPKADARALLAPTAAALPNVPRLTGREDVTQAVAALKPELIVDYGDVTPAYAALAERAQQRLGVPALLLDGALDRVPSTLRLLGAALHRPVRADILASYAEALLALPHGPVRRIVYARGPDGLSVAAADSFAAAVFTELGWQVLAPPGEGPMRRATLADLAALDPDEIVFADPRMRAAVAASPEWRALRAVREGRAFTAPALPFGWLEEPPSLNRLLGLAWLEGHDAAALAAGFSAAMYGHVLTAAELQTIADTASPLPP